MTDYLGAEQVMIEEWLDAILKAHTDFDVISAGLTDRIFDGLAPRGVRYPFIVWQNQSPPQDNLGVGIARVMVDSLYTVKAIAQADSFSTLRPVAVEIDKAITNANGTTVDGGMIHTCARQRQFTQTTVEDSVQYRQLGGIYKIQETANQGA